MRYVWGVSLSGVAVSNQWYPGNSCNVILEAPTIVDRFVSFDGSTEILHQHFDYSTDWIQSDFSWVCTSKDTSVTTYKWNSAGWSSAGINGYHYPIAPGGFERSTCDGNEASIVYKDASGNVLKTENKSWADSYIPIGTQAVLDNGQGITTLRCPDQFGQITDVYECGYQSHGARPSDSPCSNIGFLSSFSERMNMAAMCPVLRHMMFPMTGKGSGLARGVELSIETKPSSHLQLNGTVSYARSWYSGLDGILRRGNFDLPLVANLGLIWNMGRNTISTVRYGTASGRPFTPDNLNLSFAQNRGVYDLGKINSLRSAPYSRLDFRVEHSSKAYRGIATWHIDLQNALGTSNFYSNQWRPRCPKCGVLEQDQMPRFPYGGVQYQFSDSKFD